MGQSRAASGQAERGLALLLKSLGCDSSGGKIPRSLYQSYGRGNQSAALFAGCRPCSLCTYQVVFFIKVRLRKHLNWQWFFVSCRGV